jgi:glycosyltransferase involved in cell wall biosynthesis
MKIDVSAPLLAPINLKALSEQPKVSVLISNYNYDKYISEAIESVLEQTYEFFELIICDDGSTDNSKQTITEYCQRDSRVHLIAKENGGQASGFNAAFGASTGELICLLDSDDLFLPTKIACMVEAHKQTPDAGFGLHRVRRVNKQRRPQGVWPLGSVLPYGWHGERMLKGGGVLSYMPPTSGLCLHRTVAERIFPLPENYPLTTIADQVITRFAPLLTSVLRRQEVLAEYRLHGANGYEKSNITADTILREITVCKNLWQAQKDFLENLDPRLVPQLQPLENSSYLLHLEYLYARLSRSPSPLLSYHRYMRDLQADPEAHKLWFWKHSIYLPSFVFDILLNLMYRQSLLKEALARLRGVT